MSLALGALGSMISGDVRSSAWTGRSIARSALMLVVWMAALVGTAVFLLLAPSIQKGLIGPSALSDFSSSAFSGMRLLVVPCVLFVAIYLTYRMSMGAGPTSLRVVLVAVLATAGWIGASLGFTQAVPMLLGGARLYGTLGSVVLFLVWAYLIAWIVLLGGFLLGRLDRSKRATRTG
jgi:membrane protein